MSKLIYPPRYTRKVHEWYSQADIVEKPVHLKRNKFLVFTLRGIYGAAIIVGFTLLPRLIHAGLHDEPRAERKV